MLSRVFRGRHFLGRSGDWTTQMHIRVSFSRGRCFSHGPKGSDQLFDGEEIRPPGVDRLLASFLINRGTRLDDTEILESLPRLPGDHHLHLNSALFLVTPSFVNLFEPGSAFHASAINHIFGRLSSRIEPQSLVAVVDAIPDLRQRSDQEPLVPGCEGISVCISKRLSAQPVKDGGSDVPLISFQHQKFTSKESIRETCYMAPLANTLFINGLQNTMVQQNWIRDSQGAWTEDPSSMRTHLKEVDIKINYRAQDMYSTIMHNKLEQLTEPAMVKSSMGNIISELQNSDGGLLTASAELEKVVPVFLEARKEAAQEGELRIFALVYPSIPSTTGKNDFNNFVAENDSKDETGRTWLDRRNFHNLLKNRGRLYRVTSGGGGWGKKAGLLSLEPTVNIRRRTEADTSMPDFTFGDDGVEMPKPKQLIPRGSLIQFLATFLNPEESHEITNAAESVDRKVVGPHGWNSDAWYNGGLMQVLCIGTAASPDAPGDSAQLASQDNHDDSDVKDHKTSDLIFLPNRFGFLSASPMGISTSFHAPSAMTDSFGFAIDPELSQSLLEDETDTSDLSNSHHSTLIAAPGTSFVSAYRAGGDFYNNVAAKEGRVRPVIQGARKPNGRKDPGPFLARAGNAERGGARSVTAAISSLESRLAELGKNLEKQLARSQSKTTTPSGSVRKLDKGYPLRVRRRIKLRYPTTGLPGHPYRLRRAQEEYTKSRVRMIDNRGLRISKFETLASDEVEERARREQEFAYQRANQKEHFEYLQRFAVQEDGDEDLDAAGARLVKDEKGTDEKAGPKQGPDYHAHSIFGNNRDKAAEQKAIHELMEGLKGD